MPFQILNKKINVQLFFAVQGGREVADFLKYLKRESTNGISKIAGDDKDKKKKKKKSKKDELQNKHF